MPDRLVQLAVWLLRPVEWWHGRRTRRYYRTNLGRGAVTTRRRK